MIISAMWLTVRFSHFSFQTNAFIILYQHNYCFQDWCRKLLQNPLNELRSHRWENTNLHVNIVSKKLKKLNCKIVRFLKPAKACKNVKCCFPVELKFLIAAYLFTSWRFFGKIMFCLRIPTFWWFLNLCLVQRVEK